MQTIADAMLDPGEVLAPVNEETKDAFEAHVPQYEGKNRVFWFLKAYKQFDGSLDWTEVAMADQFVQIVARVSSRMFGGTELSRHKEWVNSTINFAVDGFLGAQAIKKYPKILRPIAIRFIPELSKISQHHATARRVIVPILEKREAENEKPMDFLQWMFDNAVGEERDKNFIASIQLKLSFAAIHTSAAAPTQLLYDLCAMPEYIAPLRKEIESVLAEHGALTKKALLKLVKLDSFMKESQRFNPLLLSKLFTLPCPYVFPLGAI